MLNDARRRTLQLSDSNGQPRSAIPLPSTAKKATPSSGQRMSLAGPAIRQYPAPPGTNPRHSMAKSLSSNPLLMSTSKQNYGKNPLTNSARRGSIWAGGPGATPMVTNSQPQKDPRPIKDKNFQAQMRLDIVIYIQKSGLAIPNNALSNVQNKMYRSIFEFLVNHIDPFFPIDPDAKFEEEFIPALKALHYPYAHAMDNKWLAAVGSPHSWPHLLGVLHWLVELCKMKDHYIESAHKTLQDPVSVPEEFQDSLDQRALAFEYYQNAYALWLDGDDDFVEPKQFLQDRYAKKNERVQQDLDLKLQQLSEAKAEYDKLMTANDPLTELRKMHDQLMIDDEKFHRIQGFHDSKRKKHNEAIAAEKAELVKRAEYLEQLKAEHEGLNHTVREQNLSPEEASRMTTDYEMLSRNIEDLTQKISDTERTVMSLEVSLANRISAAEEVLHTYTMSLTSLGLLPPLPPPNSDIDLTLELNTASSDPLQMLSGSDIKKIIKPTLNIVAESKRAIRAEVENERIRVDDEIEQLALECDTVDDEVNQLEKKVAAVNEQAGDLHNAAQRDAFTAGESARNLESMVANAKKAAYVNGMSAKSRLQQLQFDYREQVERVNRLRDETVRAIIKNGTDIAEFKNEVSKRLRELRECAEMD
ncbi:HEC/Ndc80p family-domain-containing protein [Rhodocollybia butyracea]|uniref:Kinetochore protein NDC80 n=1 Tax=Rhodocollybia butyracea TaxID=206335 RepID=A0A9P5PKY8_9AGAR|nr:HEC/Ndc80p family-domain-containing protein [Rhodocollybia butyracea]